MEKEKKNEVERVPIDYVKSLPYWMSLDAIITAAGVTTMACSGDSNIVLGVGGIRNIHRCCKARKGWL